MNLSANADAARNVRARTLFGFDRARTASRRLRSTGVKWRALLLAPVLLGVTACQPTTTSTPAPPAAAPTYDSTVLSDHPVAFWDLDSGGSTEVDQTGNGHTGTYEGGTPSLATMPNGDKADDFNGSGEYLTVPSSSAFSISTTHQLTFEGWIRPDVLQFTSKSDPEGYNYVDWMGKCADYSPSCEWEARMYNTTNPQGRCNRLSAYVFNPTAGLGSAADWQPNCGLLNSGQWLYVVGEYQTATTPSACSSAYPGTINIWVNGVQQNFADHEPTGCMSQYPIVPTAGSSPLNIGTMALDTWFPGAIGKVAIYNYLLTPSQIAAHYQAMTGASPSGSCANSCTIPVPTP
jgi:Concanavalin A-like lectin/glucanases superfamily